MMRNVHHHIPLTWTAIHIGLASAATYLLCSTELLETSALFLIR